jgi:hypothetical protein
MSPEDLKKIISTWKTETENTQHIEGFENALASSVKSNRWVRFGPKHEVSPDIDSYQFGLVSVGNYHNIEVNLSKESEYHRYLNPVSEARPKVKSVSIGLIASVYTVDRVQVNVESALSKAIETYLLDKALSLWAQK